jgi:hypothetical protein
MKPNATVLEVTTKGNTLYTMPNSVYEILVRVMEANTRRGTAGRLRGLSVKEAIDYLPPAMRAQITSEVHPLPK